MNNKTMSNLNIGNNSYEVKDAFARQKIEEMNNTTIEMEDKMEDYQSALIALNGRLGDLTNGNIPLGNLTNKKYIDKDTGEETDYPSWSVTDFINISGATNLVITVTQTTRYNAFYDSSKTYISGFALQTVGENVVSVPGNATYIRLSNTAGTLPQTIIQWWFVSDLDELKKKAEEISNLQVNIDGLHDDIDGINTGYVYIKPDVMSGSINASTGADTTTDFTKTEGYVPTDDADIVSASQDPRNIYIYVHYYNYSDGTYVWQRAVTNRDSLNTPIAIDKNYGYFRVVGYYNSDPKKIPLDSFYDVVYITKKYNSEQIDNLTARVTALDGGYVIPSYWQSYMEQKLSDISARNLLIGSRGLEFVFLTDTHIKNNSLVSPALIRYILKNTVISTVVNGGDWITLDASKTTAIARFEQWNKLMHGIREIRIRGNHDLNNFNGTNADNALTLGECYALMDRPMESFVDTEGKTYFVVDNASQKFRLVILDSELYHSSTMWNAEMTWMKTKLTELDSGWTILVMQHTLYGTTEGVLAPVGQSVIDNINEVYSSINASFIGILAGHSHTDYNTTEPTNGYALIVTNCDTLDGSYSGLDRTKGTVTEQAFDVVSIAFDSRKIYMTRIGAGADREISY